MSQDLKYKQATNVERRKWDKEAYAAKAAARASQDAQEKPSAAGVKRPLDTDDKEEFTPAIEGAAGPEKSDRAFLKARRQKVEIDSKVGSTEIVSAEAATKTSTGDISNGVTKTGVGWHCKVCDCFLKDSHTYLDHINGRKHQRNLGYSMRVERSTKEQVQERLNQLCKEREKASNPVETMSAADAVKAKDEELLRLKQARKTRREERKKKADEQTEDDEEELQMDPDMAAMMGFSGFGGGNKNK